MRAVRLPGWPSGVWCVSVTSCGPAGCKSLLVAYVQLVEKLCPMGCQNPQNGLHSMWCRSAANGSLELRLELVSMHMLHSVSAPCQPLTLLTLQATEP